jgi:hypothetical protein
MRPGQQAAFDAEMALANACLNAADVEGELRHLQRAHVIGQAFVGPHVRTHWHMLLVERRRGRVGAVVGQGVRIVLGAVGSAIGVIPLGNTGSSDVSMVQRMPIPPDLQAIVDAHDRQG